MAQKVLAWIDPRSIDVLAALMRCGTRGRPPITKVCQSFQEAQEWVLAQASALDLDVEWLSEPRQWRIVRG